MLTDFLQRLIRWMPLALLIMLFMVDRDNTFHKVGYIVLLLVYTGILIIRILHSRDRWYEEINMEGIRNDPEVQKMSDYNERLDDIQDSGQETIN